MTDRKETLVAAEAICASDDDDSDDVADHLKCDELDDHAAAARVTSYLSYVFAQRVAQ